jgi:glycerophosphoryl diester phosphodiesterase
MGHRYTNWLVGQSLVVMMVAVGCGDDGERERAAPNLVVRRRITGLAPAANLGHRGTGVTRAGHPLPENSLASFREAMAQGADGIELDVELTADGQLAVMHDDTLDRTTTCSGCVNSFVLETVRECRLLDGEGAPTEEQVPILEEVYHVLPSHALVNVELKVFDPPCRNDASGPRALARAAVMEIQRLGVEERTLFSSFDLEAAAAVKEEDPQLYSALLLFGVGPDTLRQVMGSQLDAIHPFLFIPAEGVRAALAVDLQVNVWTVNGADQMTANLEKGVTAIITDEPALLRRVLEEFP